MQQIITLISGMKYMVMFSGSNRPLPYTPEGGECRINGVRVAYFTGSVAGSTVWGVVSGSFVAPAAQVTLSFVDINFTGGDRTVNFDDIKLLYPAP